MDDPETARVAAVARLQRLEELLRLAPEERQTRALLARAWARYALLFLEDDLEDARDRGHTPDLAYHALRARNAYERAIHHGREVLDGAAFEAAVASDALPAFLASRRDDPWTILWLGAAWMGRLRVATENHRQLAAQSRVGEQLLEHAISRDPARAGPWGHLLLGLWRGRAGGEPEQARAHFEQSAQLAGGKLLFAPLFLARFALCQRQDSERWEALLREILDARDPAPEQRIDNAIAKRKAARDLLGPRRSQCTP
jgi:hypothetical protein